MVDREKDAEMKDSEKCPETDHGDKKVSVPELKMEAVPNPDSSGDSSSASCVGSSSPPTQLTGGKLLTKEEVLAYPVNWDVYDKNDHLHENLLTKKEVLAFPVNWDIYDKNDHLQTKMQVYVSRWAAEFLGKELGNGAFIYTIVNCFCEHIKPRSLLNHLKWKFESLEEEKVEIFFLKIWRRLIISIQEVQLQGIAQHLES